MAGTVRTYIPFMASAKPFVVVSDVHLGGVPPEVEREFRGFLRWVGDSASGLLINGDLFDVWLATRHFVVRHHVRVLAAIADLVDAGLPVYFVGGNHDALELGGAALREDLGVVVLDEPARLTLGRWRALVVHGDGVESGAPVYPAYRKRHPVLRSRAFRWAAQRMAHVDRIYDRIAAWSDTKDFVARHRRGEGTGPQHASAPLERWARGAIAAERDVDVVIAGHSHRPALVEVEPARWYVNSGDWVYHMSYALLPADRGTPTLGSWTSGQRARSDVRAPASP
ncbi:MAG TPA: UDP-2,3-diacylglucosamine diphosphatase [Gemmatimonadaceae bacterium]